MPQQAFVRDEHVDDRDAVREVNERAFEQTAEATLVEELHRQGVASVALVAEAAGVIVGHILFSPVQVDGSLGKRLVGLAPMAVLPSHQRIGIGSRLVQEGLKRCAELGWDGVVVVGQASYYPRFGFVSAVNFGLQCQFDVPSEAFMALELPGRSIAGVRGLVQYHPVFGQL